VSESVIKKLSEINHGDYVVFDWQEVTAYGDTERSFLRMLRRTPKEAYQADKEFEIFLKYNRCFPPGYPGDDFPMEVITNE
jgi:hypothetical protein